LDETPWIQADPVRLEEVAVNLLSNAVKFTPPGGRVEIRLQSREGGVSLEVRDSGCGFAPEFQPFLFQAFRQADEGTARSRGGLGLGLAIVRQLVELHGGKVFADSEGPGRGATFKVWFPIGRELPNLPGVRRPVSSQGQLAGVRVLLVDDDELTRSALAS